MRAIACCTLLAAFCVARAQTPDDFAYRAEVAAVPGLNVVTLDEATYRAAQTADLRDLRVFNAKGEALPLAPLPNPAVGPGPAHELKMVALPAQTQARDKVLADFALRIEKQGNRSVIELAPAAAPAPPSAEIGGYLLDLRSHRDAEGELVMRFATDAPDFTGRIELHGSDDLYAWRPLASGPLVRNRQLGDPVERSVFRIGRAPAFVRVGWSNTPAPQLEGVRLVERGAPPALPVATLAVARADVANAWFVDLPVGLPITQLRIRTPRDNTAVRVRVLRYDPREPRQRARLSLHARRAPEHWIAEGGAREVFRFNRDGQWIESAWFALSARTSQLRIDTMEGAGFGDALPIVEAEWSPQRYVLAVNGPGPYTVAIGNDANDLKQGPALDARGVLPKDDPAGTRLPVATIKPTAAAASVGTEHAQRIAREASWSRYLLWGVLGVAVLALALMAWAIAAQLKRARHEPGSSKSESPPPLAGEG